MSLSMEVPHDPYKRFCVMADVAGMVNMALGDGDYLS